MDNDYPVDVDEILRVLAREEVVVFRFVLFAERLLIDPRTNDRDGPLVTLVPPVNSAEERFRSLRRLRPRFDPPERIIAIQWPKFVNALETSGVWAGIERRVRTSASSAAPLATDGVLDQLRRLERREIQRALTGEGYRTIWSRVAE